MIKHKKAQALTNLQTIGVGVATLIILFAVIFLILAQVRTQQATFIVTNSTINESVTWQNNTFVSLAGTPSASLTCSSVHNGTGGILIGTGNYTCVAATGINLVQPGSGNWTANVLVTYTTTPITSVGLNATLTMTSAVATVPGWISLIVLVMIGVILLGMIAFFKRNR